jgi:O-antigen biosynthesis protein WbqP
MFIRFFAIILLIILTPLLLVCTILIYIEDGFPIFFKQKRFGINSSFFIIYKFRTMKRTTPNVASHLLPNPKKYLLKSGNFLRKFSFDELPNLINIIKGDMVFIGPRPALYNQHDLILLRKESGIIKYKPGITGWAQINGRDEISIKEKVQFEIEYIEKKSIIFDLKILFNTFINTIKQKGVTH